MDVLLILAINVAVHVLLLITMGLVTFGLLLLPAMAIMAVISFLPLAILYDTITIGGVQGGDAGHAAVRHRGPRQHDGEPPGLRPGLRHVAAVLCLTVRHVTGFLFLVVAFFTERNRALHDILSGIVVTAESANGVNHICAGLARGANLAESAIAP